MERSIQDGFDSQIVDDFLKRAGLTEYVDRMVVTREKLMQRIPINVMLIHPESDSLLHIEYMRSLFAKYPVAPFLEFMAQINLRLRGDYYQSRPGWPRSVDSVLHGMGMVGTNVMDWYFTAAQGGSLWRDTNISRYFTKSEVRFILDIGDDVLNDNSNNLTNILWYTKLVSVSKQLDCPGATFQNAMVAANLYYRRGVPFREPWFGLARFLFRYNISHANYTDYYDCLLYTSPSPRDS